MFIASTTISHKVYLNETIGCACRANVGIIVYFKLLHQTDARTYTHQVRLKPFIQWILHVQTHTDSIRLKRVQ